MNLIYNYSPNFSLPKRPKKKDKIYYNSLHRNEKRGRVN